MDIMVRLLPGVLLGVVSVLVGLTFSCNTLRIRDWDLNDIGEVHTVTPGRLVVMICDGTCQGPGYTPSLHWLQPSGIKVPIFPGRLMSVYQESRRQVKLYLQEFGPSDVGVYTCRGWVNGAWRTASVHLKTPDNVSLSQIEVVEAEVVEEAELATEDDVDGPVVEGEDTDADPVLEDEILFTQTLDENDMIV